MKETLQQFHVVLGILLHISNIDTAIRLPLRRSHRTEPTGSLGILQSVPASIFSLPWHAPRSTLYAMLEVKDEIVGTLRTEMPSDSYVCQLSRLVCKV